MTNPEMRAALDVLSALFAPTVFTDANLFCLTSCTWCSSAAAWQRRGVCGGYASFGSMLGPIFGKYAEGYRFGKLAYELVEKQNITTHKAKICMIFGDLVNFWTQHIRTNLIYLRAGFNAGSEVGDLTFACFCCNHSISVLFIVGDRLDEVYREAEKLADFARKSRYGASYDVIFCVQRAIRNLQGLTRHFSTFSDGEFDEEAYERFLDDRYLGGVPTLVCWYYIVKMQARYMFGDHEGAAAAARRAEAILWATTAHPQVPEYYYYNALIMAALHERGSPEEQRENLERLFAHQEQLREWADNCPENFLNKSALVSAEIARIRGDDQEAMRLYEQAIRSARENGFVQNEGLSNELAGQFYLARELPTTAHGHLQKARACYGRWGAGGKVKHLEQRYPQLIERRELDPTENFAASAEQIDLLSVVKASQIISGEILLSRLVETLIRIAIQEAGAR